MKRFLFLSALASVALASCVNDEAMEMTPQASDNQKISFNLPVVSGTTRAEMTPETPVPGEQAGAPGITDKYSTDEEFCVYACWTGGDYSTTATWNAGSDLYMNDVMVKYSGAGNNSWDPESAGNNPYYWPKTGKLTFAAYSPAKVKNTFTHAYGKTGLTITDFAVADNVAEQYDLMYSTRSYNRTASVNQLTSGTEHTVDSYNGVDILFKHALSSIKFLVKSDADYTSAGTEIKITKISILNAYEQGDFSENITDGGSYTADPKWANHETEFNYTAWNGTAQLLNTTATALTGVTDIILLPQAFKHATNEVSIKVDYTIQNGSGPILAQTQTLSLATGNAGGYYENAGTDIEEWEMGKRYIYTIIIGLEKIYFSPEVVEWVDVTVTPDLTI